MSTLRHLPSGKPWFPAVAYRPCSEENAGHYSHPSGLPRVCIGWERRTHIAMSRINTSTRHPHEGKPHLLHSLAEWRALIEMALLPCAVPGLLSAPRGDGHPVLLLPGFMANEGTLVALKLFLRSRGYEVLTWGFGRNVGFQSRHAKALEQKIRHLHHRSGKRVSLVGWSLGGVFALYGAHEAPECVRSVITLGSPISVAPEGSQSPPFVKAMYRLIAHPLGPDAHAMQPRAKNLRERKLLPVPLSCLYSTTDGVVPAHKTDRFILKFRRP